MCQHPGLVKLIDVFEDIDYHYIVLEYLAGRDMFNYLSKRGY